MAENSNNSSRVVTVGSLATFLNNLKSSTFYPRTAVDTMVSNRAVKGGDSAETFKVKDLKLYYDPEENPVTLSPGNGKLTIYQYGGQNMELDLSRGGNIITSNDINPDSKADRINADLYLDAVSNLPTTRRFVSDHVITKFSYPVIVKPADSGGSMGISVCRSPAVSVRCSSTPPRDTRSETVSRVVPAISVTIARS